MAAAHQDEDNRQSGVRGLDGDDPRTTIDASAPNLLSSPLEFLGAEHLRQRQLAKLITLIAEGVINRRTISGAIGFIEADFAQHILDEEISFFPVLKRVCDPEDKVDELLDLLSEEHRRDEIASEAVLKILRRMADGNAANEGDRSVLRDFADHLRRHLALENGVLLPLAEARMTPQALRSVSESMTLRRSTSRS